MVMPVKIILNLMKIWSKAKFQGKWLQKTLQMPNPLYIKMFWKSKIVPGFFLLKKQHLKRYTPLVYKMVFVFCTLEHFLKHQPHQHNCGWLLSNYPVSMNAMNIALSPLPLVGMSTWNVYLHIFSLTWPNLVVEFKLAVDIVDIVLGQGDCLNSFKTYGRGQQVLDSRFQSFSKFSPDRAYPQTLVRRWEFSSLSLRGQTFLMMFAMMLVI